MMRHRAALDEERKAAGKKNSTVTHLYERAAMRMLKASEMKKRCLPTGYSRADLPPMSLLLQGEQRSSTKTGLRLSA